MAPAPAASKPKPAAKPKSVARAMAVRRRLATDRANFNRDKRTLARAMGKEEAEAAEAAAAASEAAYFRGMMRAWG